MGKMRILKQVLLLVVGASLFLLVPAVGAAGVTQAAAKEPPLANIPNPNARPQGTITIMLPPEGEVWYTGSSHQIKWTCSGTRSNFVDVGLWKDGKLATSIAAGVTTGRTAYKIPIDLPKGRYELRVTASADARVGALRNETIVPATLTLTAPKKDAVMATGSAL